MEDELRITVRRVSDDPTSAPLYDVFVDGVRTGEAVQYADAAQIIEDATEDFL